MRSAAAVWTSVLWTIGAAGQSLEVIGTTVTPHIIAQSMRYRVDPEPADGARIQLFLRNTGDRSIAIDGKTRVLFDGRDAKSLLSSGDWAWHDTPSATPAESIVLPPDGLTVWTVNGRRAPFGPGHRVRLAAGPEGAPWVDGDIALRAPKYWLSAITFLAPGDTIVPDRMVVHITNDSSAPVEIESCRLWLPEDTKSPRVLTAGASVSDIEPFNGSGVIPRKDKGGFVARTGTLPLTYAAIEVTLVEGKGRERITLWAYLRIRAERFDISGGWVNGDKGNVRDEAFLRLLKSMYVNAAYLGSTPGYTDSPLYDKYPLRYIGHLQPTEVYDTDEILPRIHALEFLGEPQYGGGKPVAPQTVREKLHPYATTRLPTSLTNSEERIWRDYAGLSDFPHYDAYRVSAPSADAWRKYDRWGEVRIGWGSPLETIGDMCRSLRELSRPAACAIWSQGPHAGWDIYDRRERTSPTPDELRLQAYHAIATRITSLYWFNLSAESLEKFPDTHDELRRIGRELQILGEFLLEGDAYEFERLRKKDKSLDWDIASVCGPRAALLFALDLDYYPDPVERVFRFNEPRPASWTFRLPQCLGVVADVFRFDADGFYDVKWTRDRSGISLGDTANRAAIYIATPDSGLRARMATRLNQLKDSEAHLINGHR